ncbi:uncharacterized protein LOC108622717 [Ceratina calcarata]|uniref:Uncharacterized protein LOC108622717 n=1 Tax=Ceratina calcarata TaxID=156304 RepID=A0AAJ7N4B7_9HYME|nr:uncharacterized protein LOC108622717 [Ceratina calcarata]
MSVMSKRVAEPIFEAPPEESVLWQEWSDAALNRENWSTPKNGPDDLFLDTQVVQLPPSLEPYEWVRAKDLSDLTGPLTVFVNEPDYPDLITNNKHLLHSQILVDDMIPVDAEKVPLLPRTINNFELWPMILSKAVLKLCALTWCGYNEIVDFHPVTCLTGWVCLRLDIAYLSPQDKWDFLRKYADHFEWEAEVPDQESLVVTRSKKSKDAKSSTARTKRSKGTEHSKKSKATTDKSKLKSLTKPEPITLFLGLEEMKKVSSDITSDLAPCLSHFIYISQSRDIPLDPKDVKPPLARWKLFRWLKWAISEGIIDPIEYFVPIRSLKVVSPLKKCEESVINKYNTNTKENIQNSITDKQTDVGTSISKYQKRETEEKTKKKIEDELPLRDISFWADFNKMEPFIKDVHFFYKLDYFQYTARLSDRFATKQSYDQKSEKKSSRRSSLNRVLKVSEFVDTYTWPHEIKVTRNEPLYIFVDSLDEKFFLINFSTFQVSVDTFEENYDQKDITSSKVILEGNKDSLIVEKHSFFHRAEKSNCLASIVTAGTKSTVLEINRGRHLLRLYCHSVSDCYVTISSDTIFHVGDKKKMYQLMCTESETVDTIAKHVSNSVSSAYQTFGTEKYLDGLRVYYSSYLPPAAERTWENKLFYNQIHDYFLEEKVQFIRRIVPENEFPNMVRALRIFFLDPTIGTERFKSISTLIESLREMNTEKYGSSLFQQREDSIDDEITLEKQKAANVIQSFFKMIIIRKYRRIHDPTHRQHEQVLTNLLKIAELFNYNKRESLANQILRNMLKHHDKMYEIYHCSRDFEYTLQEQELKGTLTNVKPNQWLPVARFVVNSQVAETVTANIDLFIDIERYCVRAFNNETDLEMVRVINNVVTTRYAYTKLGYTIFCYCWSNEQTLKELPWTLSITTVKGQPAFRFLTNEEWIPTITTPPLLTMQELSNSYIPNSKNFISKWIVRVAKPSIVSFRLRVSYERVRMKFSVTNTKGRVLSQIKGTYVVILPMVYLGVEKESSSIEFLKPDDSREEKEDKSGSKTTIEEDKVYHVEATVLDDSWPLTRAEWCLVSEFKIKPTGSVMKTKLPSCLSAGRVSKAESVRSRKVSKQSVDNSSTLESPYWILQVVTDSESGLEISQDRTKEEAIARMKEEWAKENPDSLERGRELREAFIKKHEVRPEISAGSFERKSSSHSMRSVTKRDSQPSLIGDTSELSMGSRFEERTLKPPSALRRLPPLNVSLYKIKEDEEDESWVKTDADEEMMRNIRMMNIIYAQEDYAYFLDELNSLMKKQQEQQDSLYGTYKESFWCRRAALDDAYDARNLYVRSMKPSAPPSTKSTQTKTIKSTKNTKKSKKSKNT